VTTKEGTFDVDSKVVSPCDWLSSNPERVFHGKHTGKETFLEKVDPIYTGIIITSTITYTTIQSTNFLPVFREGAKSTSFPNDAMP
jgi:hypothetical protein